MKILLLNNNSIVRTFIAKKKVKIETLPIDNNIDVNPLKTEYLKLTISKIETYTFIKTDNIKIQIEL